jgi:hypothetical protein
MKLTLHFHSFLPWHVCASCQQLLNEQGEEAPLVHTSTLQQCLLHLNCYCHQVQEHTVACRPAARQRPRNTQLYNGRYGAEAPYTATEERCFLCDSSSIHHLLLHLRFLRHFLASFIFSCSCSSLFSFLSLYLFSSSLLLFLLPVPFRLILLLFMHHFSSASLLPSSSSVYFPFSFHLVFLSRSRDTSLGIATG